jgi:hypothetical protein
VITGLDVFRKEGVTYQELKLLNPGMPLEFDDDLEDEGHLILKK